MMEYIKKIIKKELLSLKSTSDREKLRMYDEEYLSKSIEILGKDYRKLETEILGSIQKKDYDIVFLPLKKEETENCKDIFFPVSLLKDNFKSLEKGIFLLEDEELAKLEKKIFNGSLLAGNQKYNVGIIFKKLNVLSELENKLYEIFKLNNIDWKTLNLNYFDKYYGVEVQDIPVGIDMKNAVLEYELEDYTEYWFNGYNIYWNVENKIILSNLMNNEIKEEGIFKHYIEINSGHKYLIYSENDTQHIVKVKREGEKIEVLSREKNIDFYNVLVIHDNISKKRLDNFALKYATNERKSLFSEMIKEKKSRAKSEIFKIFEIFKNTEEIELADIKINGYVEKTDNIKKYNDFLKSELISNCERDKLYLYVKYENNFENEQFLKFVLSEIQYKFNEFECIIIKK
jgi:hypothetical protein